MADYRKRVDPPAQYKNMLGDRSEKPMSVQMAEVGVEFTPAGTIFGLNDIKEELQKEEPDYYKVGMMAGVEAIGLIPGLDKVAIEAIKAGAKKVGLDKVADQTDVLLGGPKAEDSVKTEIIAGPGAKSYGDASILRAGRLEASGASPAQIEAETGRVKTGTSKDYLDNEEKSINPFKFEIDDSQIQIKNSDGAQTLSEATRQYPIIIRNIIPDHKELFEEYPGLENVEFYADSSATYAHFDPTISRNGAIVVNPKLEKELTDPNNESFRDTFFHELQHAAQFQDFKIAGLDQLGGSPTYYGKIIAKYPNSKKYGPLAENKKLVQLKDEILNIFEKHRGTGALDQKSSGATLPGQIPNPSEIFGDVKVAKQIARKMRELDAELFKTYMSTASEVEARVAGLRAKNLGEPSTNKIVSDLSDQRSIETKEEYSKNISNKATRGESPLGKKKAQAILKLGKMTDEEILRYAQGAINFSRYAKGIDAELMGFDSQGPLRGNYAKGGKVAMNEQMSFAFEDGGLRDDGMMRDPVSGNEVPPGSTAKEVRDDIPAQLSEGEYVVPADVVRYYGVKFFEDLRDNAKMGLQDMEARGRIGGEPVPAGGPQDGDLSPEEMAAIQEMMGMAEGGVVNMYKQQQDLYSPPNPAIGNPTTGMAAGGEVRGYQPGGLTQQQQAEQGFYAAGQQAQNAGFIGFPLGSTIFPSAGTGTTFTSPTAGTTAFTPVNMINMQTGARVTATTQADYDRYISEGYVVDDGTLQLKGQGSGGGGGGGGPTPPPTEPYKDWLASADFNSAAGLEKFVAGIEYDPTKDPTMGQAFGATLIAGPMAGLATAAGSAARGGLQAISDLRAASLIAKAQGLDKLSAKYDKQVADIIEKGPGILDFLDDFLATGKQKGNAWAKKNGFENIDKAIEAGVTPKPAAKPPAQPGGGSGGDDTVFAGAGRQEGFDAGTVGNLSGTTTAEKTAAVEEATAGVERGPAASEGATTASTAGGGTTAGGANLDTSMGITGLNKGGLMATPKKKAKRQYKKGGMASKK